MWTEYRGKSTPIALTDMPNGSPKLYEGAWYMRHEGVLLTTPVNRQVGVGAVSGQGRTNLQNVAMTQAALGGRIGLGALSDAGVQSAAAALYSALVSGRVSASSDATVLTFQNAYVNAGGNLPADSGGRSGVDGLYGANTRAALQSVLDAGSVQPSPTAPAGIVPASSGGGTVIVVPSTPAVPATNTTTNTTTTTTKSWEPWAIAAAVVAGAGIVAVAVHKPSRSAAKRHVGRARRHVFGSERQMRAFTRRHA